MKILQKKYIASAASAALLVAFNPVTSYARGQGGVGVYGPDETYAEDSRMGTKVKPENKVCFNIAGALISKEGKVLRQSKRPPEALWPATLCIKGKYIEKVEFN
jgi:hypothetical protein